jgi:hypothetical protein
MQIPRRAGVGSPIKNMCKNPIWVTHLFTASVTAAQVADGSNSASSSRDNFGREAGWFTNCIGGSWGLSVDAI